MISEVGLNVIVVGDEIVYVPLNVEGALILPVSSLDITTAPVPFGVSVIFPFVTVPDILLAEISNPVVVNDDADIPETEESTYALTDCCDGI